MKNNKNVFRQGDVLLIPISSIPSNLTKTKKVTLALGEVTGHHHTMYGDDVIGFADSENALAEYIEVKNNAVDLTHQEHDTISVPPGKYRKVIQVEYTPAALRNVAD